MFREDEETKSESVLRININKSIRWEIGRVAKMGPHKYSANFAPLLINAI